MNKNYFLILVLFLIFLFVVIIPFFFLLQFHIPMLRHFPLMPFPVFPLIFLIIFSILIFIVFYILIFEKENKKTKYVLPLTDEEKKILDFIKQKEKVDQNVIQKHFNLTRVKTHRILRRLESRGLIVKVKRGRSMIIILKEENIK